jgi:hypothetical protein
MKNLKKEELDLLQKLRAEFDKNKGRLGDLVLQQALVLEDVQETRKQFEILEGKLISKYGENSVINLQTGEIKIKE